MYISINPLAMKATIVALVLKNKLTFYEITQLTHKTLAFVTP